jgi:1-acyl-sn-glycerol-3-phosphate acyltransferase
MGKAPLVPAAYKGPSSGKALFKKGKMKLIIGKPLQQADFAHLPSKERLAAMTEALNHSIKELEKKLEQL